MKRRTFIQIVGAAAACSTLKKVGAVEPASAAIPWDTKGLLEAPQTYAAPGFQSAGVQALFYDGLPWQGQPTRVFAWMGIPEHKPGEKVPGIVLVHGGGGTAFANWVRLWNQRGYAAIAMDTCGSVPGATSGLDMKLPRHEMGGPPGWGGFNEIEQPITDQWSYHAVADVLLAHSLLRAQPGVDADRIGITGVSWGGYLTCIAAGIDARFRFAAPVYGCGFLGDDSVWLPQFKRMGNDAQKWLHLWDPSQYVGRAKMPFLWVTGTNDFAYPLPSLQKTYRLLPAQQRNLSIRVRMAHGHGGPGENPEEIHVFANAAVRGTTPLARVTEQRREGSKVLWRYQAQPKIVRAELNFTKDSGVWSKRNWETSAATFDATRYVAEATLPPDTTVYYLNLVDELGRVVSSEHEELKV
jgi:cephalosporin-C deacetylase-like acetyl esterase